jgi:hypothetical protein
MNMTKMYETLQKSRNLRKEEMVYVSNTGDTQIISLPRSFHRQNGLRYHLKISQADKAIYATNLTDLGGSWLYYNFQIDLPEEMASGEYEYRLTAENGDVMSEGIMVVQWERQEHEEYVMFVEYEQYGK